MPFDGCGEHAVNGCLRPRSASSPAWARRCRSAGCPEAFRSEDSMVAGTSPRRVASIAASTGSKLTGNSRHGISAPSQWLEASTQKRGGRSQNGGAAADGQWQIGRPDRPVDGRVAGDGGRPRRAPHRAVAARPAGSAPPSRCRRSGRRSRRARKSRAGNRSSAFDWMLTEPSSRTRAEKRAARSRSPWRRECRSSSPRALHRQSRS